MIIESIDVKTEGFVSCTSEFYSVHDCISTNSNYSFGIGVNELRGEIDSGIWAVSYLLSTYKFRPKDFVLFTDPEIIVNGNPMHLNEFSQYSCYMDRLSPLFSNKASVRKCVSHGIKQNGLNYSPEDIRDLFRIDSERFDRPIAYAGNEALKAMAAIGYCNGKQVFCFPWVSRMRFDSYHANLIGLLDILVSLERIVVLPIGY